MTTDTPPKPKRRRWRCLLVGMALTVLGCHDWQRTPVKPDQMRAAWTYYPPGDYGPFQPWPKGMTSIQALTLRSAERALVARVDGEASEDGDDTFRGFKIHSVFALAGDDAKRLGATIIDATRDVPLPASEWVERYAVRFEARAHNGSRLVTDMLLAPGNGTMIVMDQQDKRMCTITKDLEKVLAKVTAP